MASAIVLARGSEVFVVGPGDARPRAFGAPGEPVAVSPLERTPLSEKLTGTLRALAPGTDLESASIADAELLTRALGRPVGVASLADLRRARDALPPVDPAEERASILEVARDALRRVLSTPEEILITLAREEERLERAVGRESRAAEAFLSIPGSTLAAYAQAWSEVRSLLEQHHGRLLDRVEAQAREVVPNLSAVVGARSAARLVSLAGGVPGLARMTGARIQLLGTRRRPSPERGPRYGILYRADGMDRVPTEARGAYARSLGALAAIAARADATTRAPIGRGLVERRDRRIADLRRRSG